LEFTALSFEQEEPMSDLRANWSSHLLDPIRRLWQHDRVLAELDACTAHDLERMAQDVGVDSGTLRALAARGSYAADLLSTRIARLGLDPQRMAHREPGTARDLERVCAFCEHKRHCAADLRAGLAGVPAHCPNATTLNALVQEEHGGTVH
jgi:hypothetical protein